MHRLEPRGRNRSALPTWRCEQPVRQPRQGRARTSRLSTQGLGRSAVSFHAPWIWPALEPVESLSPSWLAASARTSPKDSPAYNGFLALQPASEGRRRGLHGALQVIVVDVQQRRNSARGVGARTILLNSNEPGSRSTSLFELSPVSAGLPGQSEVTPQAACLFHSRLVSHKGAGGVSDGLRGDAQAIL